MKISEGSFTGCTTGGNGWAVEDEANGGSLSIVNRVTPSSPLFSGCTATNVDGGALHVTASESGSMMIGKESGATKLTSCSALNGGGLSLRQSASGTVQLLFVAFASCTSTASGGALWASVSKGVVSLSSPAYPQL